MSVTRYDLDLLSDASFLLLSQFAEEVEGGIPVLPDRLSSEFLQAHVDDLGGSLITYSKLFKCLRVSMITAWVHLRLSRHGGDAEGSHVVTDEGWLTSRIGDVHIMVEDTHGKGGLCQFLVAHETVRLEALVLCRSHTREVDAVLGAPIVLLEVAQVVCHHGDVGAPFLLQSDEHAHTDAMYASHTHTVEAIASPLKLALHATRVIEFVMLTVVGLLEADDTVHAMVGKRFVVLGGERHHLNLHI